MELMVDVVQKKSPANPKFLPEQKRLKNFTIPKRTHDTDFLKKCSANERDYNEVKQHLTQSCLDPKFNFENFWQIDKIEMIRNKRLEEDFVAKRAKLREEGKQDKELSSFLVVSNDDVSKICQSGLHIGHSKKQLKILNEIGNPQLGVYLFRYVDIALNYASNNSFSVENVIIFRVLLGKVKKVQPPKDKKKIALDPTPNYDCHVSRIHPSLKDSLEDQAIGSLVYFYEYNELSKPVDKPRQCLPYAVIKVTRVNWKMQAGSTITSMKCRPKILPNHLGRGLPLENCTRVTRISKSKFFYEQFRKSAEDLENSAPAEACPFFGRTQHWNGSPIETQRRKHNSSQRWDLVTNELAIQRTPGIDVYRDIGSDYVENKKSLKMQVGVSAVSDSVLSTVTTSRFIKDPRLTKREQILRKQNGEATFHESSSSTLLNSEQLFGNINKDILASQNHFTKPALESNLNHPSFKSRDSKNEHSIRYIGENLKGQKGMKHSELSPSQLNPYKTVGNVWIPQDSQSNNKERELIIELPFYFDKYICSKKPEDVTSNKDKMDSKGVSNRLHDDDNKNKDDNVNINYNYTSEKHCAIDFDTKFVAKKYISSEREHGEFCNTQDNNLSKNILRHVCPEDKYICKRSSDEMNTEYVEQNELQAVTQSERSSTVEVHKKTEQIYSVSERAKPAVVEKKEHIEKERKENFVKERISNIVDCIDFLNTDPEMLNKTFFGRQSIPEICEQVLEVQCEDVQHFNVTSENENALEGYKECLSVQQTPCDHENMTDEREYDYLQKRMDWDNLFGKFNLNTNIPEDTSLNENVSEYIHGEKTSGEENEMDLFNTFLYPDLEITVTSLFQSKSKLKEEMEKGTSTYLGQEKDIKHLRDKTMEKYAEGQKNPKLDHTKKECSSETFSSMSKGQFTKIVQSEKHIKNSLNEALLCKNKYLSKKINRALFHVRKARRRVQSLKIGSKTRGKKLKGSLPKIHKIVHNGSFPSDSFVTSDCFSDMSSNSDSVKNTCITTEFETISEKSTLNTGSTRSSNNEHTMSDEQCSIKFTSRNIMKDKVTTSIRDTRQYFENNRCASPHATSYLNLSNVGKETLVSFVDKRKGEDFSDMKSMDTDQFATTLNTALDSSAEADGFKPGDTSRLSPIFLTPENDFSNENHIMEILPAQENITMSISVEKYSTSSIYFHAPEEKHDTSVCQAQLIPQIHDVGLSPLNIMLNNSSTKILEKNNSAKLVDSFTGQKQQELYTAEYRKCTKTDKITKSVNQTENNAEMVSPSGYLQSPVPLVDNNLYLPFPNYALRGLEREEIPFLETKDDLSNIKQNVINDILVKPLMKMSLDQKNLTHTAHVTLCKESTCSHTSSDSTRLSSSLLMFSKQDVEAVTANFPSAPDHCDAMPTKTKQNFISSMTSLNENSFSCEPSNSNTDLYSDFKYTQVGTKLKSLDFKNKISEILKKADETSSLNLLHEQIAFCKHILPVFVEAFQEKQGCSFEHVLVSKEILGSAGRNLQLSHKLNPCAIESFVEVQIIMETIEFIKNKKRLIEGEPTFRSLLWYDNSLCGELFGGQSGYQQQSNFYPAFQRRLKYSPLNELQSYHKQLVDVFENTKWENNSYYTFLKSRREIEECEAAMNSHSNFSDFFLSVPYVCGVNYGDTLEDLEATRKNVLQLINLDKSRPGIILSSEKEDHLWVIMEIIATKIDFIRNCGERNIKASLFGLEHIFFDAAKSLVWKYISVNKNLKDEQMLTYNYMIEYIAKKSSQQSCIHEKTGGHQNANYSINNSLMFYHDICWIGEILDEAQYADTERLQQLMCRCTEHMEMLKKYFQILQEEDISVLITKENVLGFMKIGGINPVILKPEAVEIYTEITMIYETVFYLKNSIARKVGKPEFRSLLWFDSSLLPELFRWQEKMASFSYRKDNLLKMIESSISEVQEEVNVIYDYPENLNCPYALHLLTRELEELSGTRELLKTSKSSISMCVDLVPYTICLNYGSNVYELELNYNQFYSLFEKLTLAERKDLGKMAHIMKIMKTIEHMKFVCSELEKSPLPLVIHQMLKNWRKEHQIKQQDKETNPDGSEGPHSQYKRPANVTSESSLRSCEERVISPKVKRKRN